jgi:hypothetical protein
VPALLPDWVNVTPWVLQRASQFRPNGPPPLRSWRYARDYREMQAIGSLTSATRTDEQTQIARFWLTSAAICVHSGEPHEPWVRSPMGLVQRRSG